MTVQLVEVEPNPEWKPNWIAGGFAGHCTNQSDQTWIYKNLSPITTIIRLRKSRYHGSNKLWASKQHGEFVDNGAVEFYDYNF